MENNNNSINLKGLVKDRERIFKEIARSPRDLTTLKAYAVKKKIVESGGKFDKAIAMLKASGRIIVKPGSVIVNPNEIKQGIFVAKGKNGYIQLDGDNRQFSISSDDSLGFKSNERVNISFTDDEVFRRPFIISALEGEGDNNEFLPKLEKDCVLGRVIKISHDQLAFIPNDRRFTKPITILNPKNTLSKYQDKICVMKVTDEEKLGFPAAGIITEIKGDAGNPIHEYEAIAESHGANMSWSDEVVQAEIDKLPTEVDLSGFTLVDEAGKVIQNGDEKIVDLRELAFTTVDPATCKDMDDAIYSTVDNDGNLVVYTAVANVTKYVDLESEIGKRYLNAGFTTYAPNRAYNILPPELSTGICSLNPNVDRLALVIKNVINKETGLPISTTVMDAVINSKEKYSYEQAQAITDKNKHISNSQLEERAKNGTLSKDEQVVLNARVADVLWKGFNQRNMINFETKDEYDVIFNDDLSEIVDIQPQENCAYHKVIEAFMLTANESAARFAKQHNLPNVYRVHQSPNEEKLAQAYEFFRFLDIPFDGDLSPVGVAKLSDMVKGTNKEKTVNNFLIRMQSKAKYSSSTSPNSADFVRKVVSGYTQKAMSTSNKGLNQNAQNATDNISHFALQSKAYSHTTSPIRRISDYVTHKNILAFLKGKELLNEVTVSSIANWANAMQDENKLAEREFVEVSSAIYCENHIGETMKGCISAFKLMNEFEGASKGVDNLAVVVENEEKGIRVLIPAKEFLPKGVSNVGFSTFGCAIVSKSTGKPIIKLCEEVEFIISSADRLTRVVTATTDLERKISNEKSGSVKQTDENNHSEI